MSEPEDNVLATVDRALETGAATSADPAERELEELALMLAAETAEPEPQFARELGARVRDGFPRRRRLPRIALQRPPMPVLAAAAAALVALAVVVSLTGEDKTESVQDTLKSGPPQSLDSQEAAPKSAAGRESAFAPGTSERRIERSASITLAAPDDRLDEVSDDITTITDRRDGFVLRSSLSTGDEGASGGSFELRIPSAQLRPALRDLARLGQVRSRSQSGQDITRGYATAADRLQAARTERKGLLRRLGRGGSDTEIEATRRRLDINATEIRGLRSQLRELRLRSDYAAVSVTLERKGGDSGATAPGDGLGGAIDDALGSMSSSVEIVIRALGVGIPLVALASALWLGAAVVRRRRREGALSA